MLTTTQGGHVNTYFDPKTGAPIDFGVQAFLSLDVAKNLFARFSVAIENATQPPWVVTPIDFNTGKPVVGPPPDPAAVQLALQIWGQKCAQYLPLIFPGYYNLPDVIPADLLMPFGAFVQTYGIGAALPTIFSFAFGLGDVLATPTIFVMQSFGALQLNDLFAGTLFITKNHANIELYLKAQALLAADLQLTSKVGRTVREATGVRMIINTPTGQKLVKCKKLLITIPPTKDIMYPFDQDDDEKALWAKWTFQNSYNGIIINSGLPDGQQLVNVNPNPATAFLPTLPFANGYTFSGIPGFYTTQLVGNTSFTMQAAKDLVRANFKAMLAAKTFPLKQRLDFAAFVDHNPLQLRPSAADLAGGFYKQIYALQGRKNTFFTGAAWCADYSSVVWQFTETVLPRLL